MPFCRGTFVNASFRAILYKSQVVVEAQKKQAPFLALPVGFVRTEERARCNDMHLQRGCCLLSFFSVMKQLSGLLTPSRSRGALFTTTRLFSSLLMSPPPINFPSSSRRGEQLFAEPSENATTVTLVGKSKYELFRASLGEGGERFLSSILGVSSMVKFPGTKYVFVPDAVKEKEQNYAFFDDSVAVHKISFEGILSGLKTNTTYQFLVLNETSTTELPAELATKLCQSYVTAAKAHMFNFLRTKTAVETPQTRLVWPAAADQRAVLSLSRAYTLYKDLVDSPALTLGPQQLADAAVGIAEEYGASSIKTYVGVEELLKNNFPQVAAVGMASSAGREPRVVDFRWEPSSSSSSSASLPLVTIVGKGVCFDTGGLNIKGGGGMRQMKKDMAGASQALALSLMIMDSQIPVRLRVLLPIVENSISGVALRPGDVIRARNNVTTEIHNTDAEGRLILADCLVAATEEEEEQPALLLDFATLTGAARVALGFELPALFCNNHTELMRMFDLSQSSEVSDPMWPMPLWGAYKSALKSSVADLVNAAEGAGAITAALYLQEFVGKSSPASESSDKEQEKDGEASGTDTSSGSSSGGNGKPLWMHIDFMGTKAGMAEPQGLRSCFEYIKTHVAKRD